jgi:hypothetical protein
MAVRKHFTEFGLSMVGTPYAVCRQRSLGEVEARAKADGAPLHIYTIGVRPKLTIDPDSVVVTKERVRGRFKAQIQDKSVPIEWDVENPFLSAELKLETAYPYNEFALVHPDGRVSGGDVTAVFSAFQQPGMPPTSHPCLDIEALYVGQSYGEQGERSAVQRLRSHETLQAIYADINERTPDKDVWLILWRFNETQHMTLFPTDTVEGDDQQRDDAHIDNVLGNPVSGQQKVNFTEAAMIKYLQPPYNTIYKQQFPTPAHKSYSECYDVDLNMIAVELQMWSVRTRVFSGVVTPGFYHVAEFPLHSREDRLHMFEFAGHDLMSAKGPVF